MVGRFNLCSVTVVEAVGVAQAASGRAGGQSGGGQSGGGQSGGGSGGVGGDSVGGLRGGGDRYLPNFNFKGVFLLHPGATTAPQRS